MKHLQMKMYIKKQPELLRLAENETRPAIKVKKAKKKKGVETA